MKDSYKTGEKVIVKIGMATDLGYMLFVNGERVAQDEWNGEEYWQFSFTMPDEDVVIEFKTYDGFLRYPNEDMADIENKQREFYPYLYSDDE